MIRDRMIQNFKNLSHTFLDPDRKPKRVYETVFDANNDPILRSDSQVYFATHFFDRSVITGAITKEFDFESAGEQVKADWLDRAGRYAQELAAKSYFESYKNFILLPNFTLADLDIIESDANKNENFIVLNPPKENPRRVPLYFTIDLKYSRVYSDTETRNHSATMAARCNYSFKTGEYLFTKFL